MSRTQEMLKKKRSSQGSRTKQLLESRGINTSGVDYSSPANTKSKKQSQDLKNYGMSTDGQRVLNGNGYVSVSDLRQQENKTPGFTSGIGRGGGFGRAGGGFGGGEYEPKSEFAVEPELRIKELKLQINGLESKMETTSKQMQNYLLSGDFSQYKYAGQRMKHYQSQIDSCKSDIEVIEKNNPELKDPGFSERVLNTIAGGVKDSGASTLNALGFLFDRYAKLKKTEVEIATKLGIDPDDSYVLRSDKDAYERAKHNAKVTYDYADELKSESNDHIEYSKKGLGGFGGALVDIGAAGTQWGIDAAAGAISGGGSLIPMMVRSFGSASQEARLSGASLGEQGLYGTASAAVAGLTEKISSASKLFKKLYGSGITDNFVNKIIGKAVGKFASSSVGKKFLESSLRIGASAFGEGLEEIVEYAVNPILKLIYQSDSEKSAMENLKKTYGENFDFSDMLYDGMIGAALGLVGGIPGSISGARSVSSETEINQQTDVQQSDAAQSIMDALNGKNNSTDANNSINENGLVSLTKLEQDNLSSGKRNKIISTFKDAAEFIRNALTNKQSNDRAYLGKIPDSTAQMVMEQTGVDVSGYNAILPSDSVRHMFKNHGNANSEAARGQIALTPETAANISSVLSNPDTVSLSGKTDARGRPVLIFEKQIGDNYVTAQAVADGTKSLSTDTLYIKKQKNPQAGYNADIGVSPAHNAQSVLPQDSSNGTITQSTAENNQNPAQTPMENPVQETQSDAARAVLDALDGLTSRDVEITDDVATSETSPAVRAILDATNGQQNAGSGNAIQALLDATGGRAANPLQGAAPGGTMEQQITEGGHTDEREAAPDAGGVATADPGGQAPGGAVLWREAARVLSGKTEVRTGFLSEVAAEQKEPFRVDGDSPRFLRKEKTHKPHHTGAFGTAAASASQGQMGSPSVPVGFFPQFPAGFPPGFLGGSTHRHGPAASGKAVHGPLDMMHPKPARWVIRPRRVFRRLRGCFAAFSAPPPGGQRPCSPARRRTACAVPPRPSTYKSRG